MSRQGRRRAQIAHARKMSEQSRELSPREIALLNREARVRAVEAEQEKVHALTRRHEFCGTTGDLFARRGNPLITEKEREAERVGKYVPDHADKILTGHPLKDKLFRIRERQRLRILGSRVQVPDDADKKQVARSEYLSIQSKQQSWKEKQDERI